VTSDHGRLFRLLPRIYQLRDAERGDPLSALLAVVTEQADLVEADIAALYEDWFIETCQDWVVPYLGELVGYGGGPVGETARVTSRADVANTVGNRRRKGTLALLEQLSADVAGWPARAVEFRRLLGVTASVRLYGGDPRTDARRRHRGGLADVHDVDAMDRVDGPFDRLAHTVEVPRISAAGRRPGRYDIPAVGLHVWRLRPYRISHAPAFCEDRDRANFTFSILSNDTPLVTRPVEEPSPTHVADETNVPAFIRRRAFTDRLAHYYGPGKSLCIWLADDKPVTLDRIVSADLSDWRYNVGRGQVAVDPVLGRISFPNRTAPDTGVWVTYHHAFAADLGGGEYSRPTADDTDVDVLRVGPDETHHRIMDAVRHWRNHRPADPAKRRPAVIEIAGSGAYQEQIEIKLDAGDRLTVRAENGSRPVLRLLDWYSNRPDALRVIGTGDGSGPAPRIAFDGLLITGRSLQVRGAVGAVTIRHCTLVPGWSLDHHCAPEHAEEASLELFDTPACLEVEHSILGTVLVNAGDDQAGPNHLFVSDSIVDAADPELDAVTGPDDRHAYAVLNLRRSTVFGGIRSHAAGRVENSILGGPVHIAQRQAGCVRFCWLPPESRTPPRFHCEPERSGDPERVVPQFTATRYGHPGYAQLDLACASEIRRGADDGSELGVFHDLFQPQREDELRRRLEEYTPAGGDAGLIFVT
jgi:hypothetical protein